MKNILNTFKLAIYLFLALFLFSSSLYAFFPDSYASYRTGYSVDSIVGYRAESLDHNLICKDFFPEKVAQATGEIISFSFLMIPILFILIITCQYFLMKKNDFLSQSKNTMRNFIIIFSISSLIFFWGLIMREYEYDYLTGCDQFQANSEFL